MITVFTFEELLKEMYWHQNDKEFLLGLEDYIIQHKQEYSELHLFTLINAIKGYLQ